MSHEARGQAFLARIADSGGDLPFDPELLGRLFEQTGDGSQAPLEELARTIQKDQGLSARVLSLANSAYYGLQAEVATVTRAVSLLGLKELRNIVLLAGIQGMFREKDLKGLMDLRAYWRHQLETAQAAKWLADQMGQADPEILFTAGLLHDLGKLLVALYQPEDWRAIRRRVELEDLPYAKVENEHWGLEHGLIGALAMNAWNLPPALSEPVNWHHAPNMAPENPGQALLLCLADFLSHAVSDPGTPVGADPVQLLDSAGLDLEESMAALSDLFHNDEFKEFLRLVC